MSLVAYGASDDSEASDTDGGNTDLNEELASPSKSEVVGNNNNAVAHPQAGYTETAVKLSIQSDVSSPKPLNGTISDEEETSDFLKGDYERN